MYVIRIYHFHFHKNRNAQLFHSWINLAQKQEINFKAQLISCEICNIIHISKINNGVWLSDFGTGIDS